MKNLINKFKNSSHETKQFFITVLILFVIVIGTFLFAFFRINFARSGSVQEGANPVEAVQEHNKQN